MIFLDLYTLPTNTSGLDNIIVSVITVVPAFVPLLLAFVFFTIFLGGIGRQKARTGTSDYPMWAVIASLSTFMIALIMTMIEEVIRLDWLVIITVVTIFSGVWLFLSRKVGEV